MYYRVRETWLARCETVHRRTRLHRKKGSPRPNEPEADKGPSRRRIRFREPARNDGLPPLSRPWLHPHDRKGGGLVVCPIKTWLYSLTPAPI